MNLSINNPQFWRTNGINEKVKQEFRVIIDKEGNLQIPEKIKDNLELKPETELKLKAGDSSIIIKRADPLLTKVYVEPTTECNLNCKTCVRHSWNQELGHMEMPVYKKMIEDLKEFKKLNKISFWGIGEPLFHPNIIEMIDSANELPVKTQIITNGLLLDEKVGNELLEAGLDSLVVSIDGTSPETMSDLRSGADLKQIINNVKSFKKYKNKINPEVEIGIEYVIMKSNVDELKDLRKLAYELGASFIFLTNLLPYTESMTDQILYSYSISRSKPKERTDLRPEVYLPPTDLTKETIKGLSKIMGKTSSVSTNQVPFDPHGGYCKFVEEGSIAVNKNGEISPCIALMHSYNCYLRERKKYIKNYSLGNTSKNNIQEIWNSNEFKDFRKKLIEFPFSECTQCSGCDMSETNEEDCHGNTFPVCGDCLWAKGVIQCP
ncbi:MAG: radical SAM protein [Halanaerobiales bacterium]